MQTLHTSAQKSSYNFLSTSRYRAAARYNLIVADYEHYDQLICFLKLFYALSSIKFSLKLAQVTHIFNNLNLQ